ncbi:cytosine permease [Chloroflexota bacterium]
MSYLPQDYYEYYPAEYQPQFWQAAFSGLINIAILIAVGAWALSLVRKAVKGEEVEFPL